MLGEEGRVAPALGLEEDAGPWRLTWLRHPCCSSFTKCWGGSAGHKCVHGHPGQAAEGWGGVCPGCSLLPASPLAAPTSLASSHSKGAATDPAASSSTCGSQEAEQAPRNVLRHALDSCLCPQPGFPPPCPCDRQLPGQDMNIIPFCWRQPLSLPLSFHSCFRFPGCNGTFSQPFELCLHRVFGLLVRPLALPNRWHRFCQQGCHWWPGATSC